MNLSLLLSNTDKLYLPECFLVHVHGAFLSILCQLVHQKHVLAFQFEWLIYAVLESQKYFIG